MAQINYVYVAGTESGPPYKVGHSTNPEARLASFLAGSAASIRVLQKWQRDGDAGKVERLAHKRLKPFRVNREWFSAPFDQVQAAIEAAIVEADAPAPERTLLQLANELRERNEIEAADAVLMLYEMKMVRRAVAKKAGEAFSRNQAAKRKRKEQKMQVAEDLWRNKALSTPDVVARTGLSRNALYKLFGARGTPRFGNGTR
jgi:predicted GIY-YIG superfamily endonuclease